MTLELPRRRYLNTPIDVAPDAGGQTRAMLLRNRIFVREAGIEPTILTFNPAPDYPERREVMLDRGLLLPEIAVENVYEWHRERDWDQVPDPDLAPLEDLSQWTSSEELTSDGRPFRRTYLPPEGPRVDDFLRDDGSTFLRIPRFVFRRPRTWPRQIVAVDRSGSPVTSWSHVRELYGDWMTAVSGGEPTINFIDSRFMAPIVLPLHLPHVQMVYVLHNVHVAPPRRWSSPTNASYHRLIPAISHMDAMVTLTERQRDDLVLRRGPSPHLHVVRNPVDLPPDAGAERDPRLAVVVARLEAQKRLHEALHAFALVHEQVPDARLDVYGAGHDRDPLERLAGELGLDGVVTFKGHDPAAREALERASAFLMTSEYEGYPLSTLESLSHGCPVVSYDVKYGPREQIVDGRNGFLVADRDRQAFADRVVELLTSPDTVARMSREARAVAAEHSQDRFARDWQCVLAELDSADRRHVVVRRAALEDLEVEVGRRWRRALRPEPGELDLGSVPARGTLTARGRVVLSGVTAPGTTLDDAVVTAALFHAKSGAWVEIPCRHHREGRALRFEASADLAELLRSVPRERDTRLRIRVNWWNHASEWHFPAWDSRRGAPGNQPDTAEERDDAED